jgi:hypothetical protein
MKQIIPMIFRHTTSSMSVKPETAQAVTRLDNLPTWTGLSSLRLKVFFCAAAFAHFAPVSYELALV